MPRGGDHLFDIQPIERGRIQLSYSTDARDASMRRTRNAFRVHPPPDKPMSTVRWRPATVDRALPADLHALAAFFEVAHQGRERFRWTLRDSLDELLDGRRTGRWCYQHLRKTEKTYLGTAVEVNLTREFEITDGCDLDWKIAGIEVDCKFSRDLGGWEIPMEMYVCADHGEQSAAADHPALLVWMNDDTSEWAAGLMRVTDTRLRWKQDGSGARIRAYNRDNKRKVAEDALNEIYWLWGGIQDDLPQNLLRHLDASTRDNILRAESSGQGRVNDLFRHVQDRLINREVILTVAQEEDAPKRARDTRIQLRDAGIIVLGHQSPHRRIAESLNIPVPRNGSWVSTRVFRVSEPHDPRAAFFLDGGWWAKAADSDPVVAAPRFPKEWSDLNTRTGASLQ